MSKGGVVVRKCCITTGAKRKRGGGYAVSVVANKTTPQERSMNKPA